MTTIASYVFLDLETTGLPTEECNKTRITELSLIAVKRSHILETNVGNTPRVQQKLTLCFNPRKLVHPSSTQITSLSNELLEYETPFNKVAFDTINNFLSLLSKPVCLIAQNGLNFDYPILKKHLVDLGVSFSDQLMCADSLHAFYDILKETEENEVSAVPSQGFINESHNEIGVDELDSILIKENPLDIKKQNESTPKKSYCNNTYNLNTPKKVRQKNTPSRISKVRRKIFWNEGSKPKHSYKLKNIYERLFKQPCIETHRAENDCTIALECSVAVSKEFVKWVDENHCPFADIKPMTIGVPLGLLVLTGMLWGCTNPFIRQGTKGLRQVKANTILGQAYAEIVFLLGNWRYVVPWLVNQSGSLVYLVAIQTAPLSLAVPTANSLAFVFTAVTGAAVGAEEPLDLLSFLGILMIGVGTMFCCWDEV